jgi:hypothetical protein
MLATGIPLATIERMLADARRCISDVSVGKHPLPDGTFGHLHFRTSSLLGFFTMCQDQRSRRQQLQ